MRKNRRKSLDYLFTERDHEHIKYLERRHDSTADGFGTSAFGTVRAFLSSIKHFCAVGQFMIALLSPYFIILYI